MALGVITRPHGVRGEVRARLYNPESDVLYQRDDVWLRLSEGSEPERAEITAIRPAGRSGSRRGMIVLGLRQSADRDHAERLRGAELCVPRADLPAPAEEESYVVDLIGMDVRHEDGTLVGRVSDVLDYPAAQCLQVDCDDGEREIPLVEPWIQELSAEQGRIVVGDVRDVPVVPRTRRRRGRRRRR